MLSFGLTALPDPPYTRLVELFQRGESLGFEYGWTYDSHILWQETYATLAIAGVQTESLKLGHCVTNPGIRDPTITASWYATMQDVTNGRMVMGIGRGDSSRRVVGLKPVRVDEFERRLRMVKDLMNGRAVDWNEKELELKWVRKELPQIPMHVAGYGPRALGVAGRVGDGVIIQLADPQIIQWIMATARKAAEEAGRDPAALQCVVCAPSHVSDDLAEARDQVRWFPAMVSNHVMDLIERYGENSDEIPSALTDYVKARKFYDYKDHSRVGAAHGEFVTDEICDRFCVLGNSEQVTEKLQRARVSWRRSVRHLPDDREGGRDARRLRQRRDPGLLGRRRLAQQAAHRDEHDPAEPRIGESGRLELDAANLVRDRAVPGDDPVLARRQSQDVHRVRETAAGERRRVGGQLRADVEKRLGASPRARRAGACPSES